MLYRIHKSKDTQQFPLNILMFGINHVQEPINRQAGMFIWQWFYTVKGEGELIVDGKRYTLTEQQGFLIAADEGHSYRALTEEWVIHFIGFSGDLCKPLLTNLSMAESGIYQFSDPTVFLKHLRRILEIYESSIENKSLRYSTACYEFLCELSQDIRKVGQPEDYSDNIYITNAILYMEDHYQENFSLDELADHVGLSKSYLCHLFKTKLHESIGKHLQVLRLGRASFMLHRYPGKRIAEIAKECGFETPSYFSKVFRKEFGMTPEEYRGRH